MLIPKSNSNNTGGLTQTDLDNHNLDPSAHPPLNNRISQLENDIKYKLSMIEQKFTIDVNRFITIPIDSINDKHYEILRVIPTLDISNQFTRLMFKVYNPNSYTLTDFQVKVDISPYLALFGNTFLGVRDVTNGVYVPSVMENNTNAELTAQFSNSNGILWIKDTFQPFETKEYEVVGLSTYTYFGDVFDFYDSFASLNVWWSPVGATGNYFVTGGNLYMNANWGGCCAGSCIYNHLRTSAIFTKPFIVETRFRIANPSTQAYTRCCNICYQVIFANYEAIGISNATYGYHFRSGAGYTYNAYQYPTDTNYYMIETEFWNDKLVLRTDYGINDVYTGVDPNAPQTGYIGIAGDTDSPDHDIIDWIRVRKLAKSEPMVEVYFTNTFDTKYWINIVRLTIDITPTSLIGQERIIFTIDDTNSYYFDTSSRQWRLTDGTLYNTKSEIDLITPTEWEIFPLGEKLAIENLGQGQLIINAIINGDVSYEDYPFYSIAGNNLYIRNVYDERIEIIVKTFKTSV